MSDKGFFSRWSQRKQEQQDTAVQNDITPSDLPEEATPPADTALRADTRGQTDAVSETEATTQTEAMPPEAEPATPLNDEQMPDLESIDGNSNVSAFFSEGVSEKLRKKALKAMFLKPEFNIRDGMDDYDLDYSDAPELAADVASGLRKWFKNKDPLKLNSESATDVDQTGAAAAATEADADDSPPEATDMPQNATPDTDSTETENLNTATPDEPDQKQANLSSGKTTTTDPAENKTNP